ncbi:hypothetical protein [Chryseotalea sanaruensis]|nr:hypothetical protein [Chryseotalea sanaruensis]
MTRSDAKVRSVSWIFIKNRIQDFVNRPYFIFGATLTSIVVISYVSFRFSFDFSGTPWSWLNIIELSEESSKELISENLSNTGAIVALSFVVIGFLFEIIKERTGRNLEELVRATYLYLGLSVTLISLSYMVLLNLIKNSISLQSLKNLSISSSYLVLVVLIMIGIQFASLIKLFNSKTLSDLSKYSIIRSGLNVIFQEYYIKKSKSIMNQFLLSKGLHQFNYINHANLNRITLTNNRDLYCSDINLILLNWTIKSFSSDNNEKVFQELYINKFLPRNAEVFFYAGNQNTNLSITTLTISPSFYLQKTLTSDQRFASEREKLRNMVIRAAELGDQEELARQLDIFQNLYSIYFQTRPAND